MQVKNTAQRLEVFVRDLQPERNVEFRPLRVICTFARNAIE